MGLFSGTQGFILGFTAGYGFGFFSREIIPTITGLAKPASKSVIRTGLFLIEKTREGMAKFGETMEDLAAEVNLEMRQEKIAAMHPKRPKKKVKLKKSKHPISKHPISEDTERKVA
jgi:hypothetical protein